MDAWWPEMDSQKPYKNLYLEPQLWGARHGRILGHLYRAVCMNWWAPGQWEILTKIKKDKMESNWERYFMSTLASTCMHSHMHVHPHTCVYMCVCAHTHTCHQKANSSMVSDLINLVTQLNTPTSASWFFFFYFVPLVMSRLRSLEHRWLLKS